MRLMDFPLAMAGFSFVLLFGAAQIGDQLRKRMLLLKEEERHDFGVVLGATLTLLGLLIGFSFSMAVSRYDQRKNYEEAEATAVSTEYARADLLPANDASRIRGLLRKYVDQRRLFYTTHNPQRIAKNKRGYSRAAERDVVCRANSCGGTADACGSSGGFRDERGGQLTGKHAGRVVEPNSNCRLAVDVGHSHLLQLSDWVGRTSDRSAVISDRADCSVDRLLFNF